MTASTCTNLTDVTRHLLVVQVTTIGATYHNRQYFLEKPIFRKKVSFTWFYKTVAFLSFNGINGQTRLFLLPLFRMRQKQPKKWNCIGFNFNQIKAYSKGLLVRGFSWFVANPFIFNVLLGKNDVGYIPRTSSPPSYLFQYKFKRIVPTKSIQLLFTFNTESISFHFI